MPPGPRAVRVRDSATSMRHRAGSSVAATSSAEKNKSGSGIPCAVVCTAETSWPTISSVPPGATASASARKSTVRGPDGRCMNCAVTRSNRLAGGAQRVKSCCCHSMPPATASAADGATPARRLRAAARSRATAEKSTPVTCQPRPASQIASAPSPQPMSRARPGARSEVSLTNTGLAAPLHTSSRAL